MWIFLTFLSFLSFRTCGSNVSLVPPVVYWTECGALSHKAKDTRRPCAACGFVLPVCLLPPACGKATVLPGSQRCQVPGRCSRPQAQIATVRPTGCNPGGAVRESIESAGPKKGRHSMGASENKQRHRQLRQRGRAGHRRGGHGRGRATVRPFVTTCIQGTQLTCFTP